MFNQVFQLDSDGYPVFPVGSDGEPTFPVDESGQPVFALGPNEKPMVPADSKVYCNAVFMCKTRL